MTAERDKSGRWRKGVCPNPGGVGKNGKRRSHTYRKQLEEGLDGVIATLLTKAQGGDTQAARLVLDRVLPTLRPVDKAVHIQADGDQLQAVVQSALEGRITPLEAQALTGAISNALSVEEGQLIRQRMAEIESLLDRKLQ